MNTCDTCKWWGVKTWMRYRRGDSRCCEHVTSFMGDYPHSALQAVHDNDYGSEVFTGPKFGCIHHEEMPRATPPK